MYRLIIASMLLFTVANSSAQNKDGFKKLPSGLAYKMLKNAKGTNAKAGDQAKINFELMIGDSVIRDSKKMNNGNPMPQSIQESKSATDLMEGFMMLSKGDIALFKLPASVVFPNDQQRPPFIKADADLTWKIEMVDILSKEQVEAEISKTLANEAGTLKKYIKDNKLKAKQLKTGTYVAISKQGTGAVCEKGKNVKMSYTGYLLDGTKFDSNVDPKFGHTQPFEFPLGQGRVIKGWDNGIMGMKVGTKAKLIIPSANAYGARATPGNDKNPKGIPANSPLVFDIEVLSVSE